MLNRKINNPLQPVYTGIKHQETTQLQLFTYNETTCVEEANYLINDFTGFESGKSQNWLNIHGIHDADKIKTLCNALQLHSLTIQDILDVQDRPKFLQYDSYWFFSIKSILPKLNGDFATEQISFVLGSNYLVSFQEKKADYFEHVRYRIREKVGIVRERGGDYLLYLLIESILDNYAKTITQYEKTIENVGLFTSESDSSPESLLVVESCKRDVYMIKKALQPIRDFTVRTERDLPSFLAKKHVKYYIELKDLCFSLIEDCEHLEMQIESKINLFFSLQGHKMNQVMKTLTVVSTIFIPLTFIAGVYGMNFVNIPELQLSWGYYAVWGVMLLMLVVMLAYFKKKKWF